MPAFELPAPYMPYPPRLNPHVERARRHSKEWAKSIGVLDSTAIDGGAAVWDEAQFDTADFALFAARTYPDAPAPELDLLTDWGVWLFFFDDFIERFKTNRDREGARAVLAKLVTFLSVDEAARNPEVESPLERGLTDLWSRTMPSRSLAWRSRFAESTRQAIQEGPLWELANVQHDRSPNPIEYVEMRRQVGGAPWAADLVEHALGIELPPAIASTRPIRLLQDTFSDGVHLRNDLYSYEKETEVEGEIHNGILVIERFLGCAPSRAAELVNDLATSRMRQFERTITTELPALFEENVVPLADRVAVLRYVKGLQDWMGGDHEWHLTTSRYRTAGSVGRDPSVRRLQILAGLGTSAARFPAPPMRRPVAAGRTTRFAADGVSIPFAARVNPGLERLRTHNRDWIRRMGMLDPSPLGPSPWSERTIEEADFARVAGLCYPDAPDEALTLASDWNVWGFFIDDVFVARFKRRRDAVGAKAFVERLRRFTPPDSRPTPVPTDPAERSLDDVWRRVATRMSDGRRRRFAELHHAHLDSYLWELANLVVDRLPDAVDYVEMRRHSFAGLAAAEMMQHVAGLELADDSRRAGAIRALARCFTDVVALHNDLVSYRKEIEEEGEITNGVPVAEAFLGVEAGLAADVVRDLATARLGQIEFLVTTDLAPSAESGKAEEARRAKALEYAGRLRDWIAGYVRWSRESGRYAAQPETGPGWRRPLPSGLGTAAFRVPRLPVTGRSAGFEREPLRGDRRRPNPRA